MKLYRIQTQDLNYQDIMDYLDEHFRDGYTIINTNGAWQSKQEKSLIIEIVQDDRIIDYIGKLAFWLKKHNKQESVLVQIINLQDVWDF